MLIVFSLMSLISRLLKLCLGRGVMHVIDLLNPKKSKQYDSNSVHV